MTIAQEALKPEFLCACGKRGFSKAMCRCCYLTERRKAASKDYHPRDPREALIKDLTNEIAFTRASVEESTEFLGRVIGVAARMFWKRRIREAEIDRHRLLKELNHARSARD